MWSEDVEYARVTVGQVHLVAVTQSEDSAILFVIRGVDVMTLVGNALHIRKK